MFIGEGCFIAKESNAISAGFIGALEARPNNKYFFSLKKRPSRILGKIIVVVIEVSDVMLNGKFFEKEHR